MTDHRRFADGVVAVAVQLQAETAAVEAERAAKLAGKARRAAGRIKTAQVRLIARNGARAYTQNQKSILGLSGGPDGIRG